MLNGKDAAGMGARHFLPVIARTLSLSAHLCFYVHVFVAFSLSVCLCLFGFFFASFSLSGVIFSPSISMVFSVLFLRP